MIRVAFLGSDSTHTEAFGRRMNLPDGPFHAKARVVSIWGEDAAQTRKKAEDLQIERVCSAPAEALKNVDLAMVIGRFGESHYHPARQALEMKVPTFVDKPFTVSFLEAQELANLSTQLSVPLCSSSPLRFAKEVLEARKLIGSGERVVAATASMPANCIDLGVDPRFESPFFYGIHGTEVLLEVLGHEIQSFEISRAGGSAAVSLKFKSGQTGLLNYVRSAGEFYSLTLYTEKGEWHRNIELDGSYYTGMLTFLLDRFARDEGTIPLESSLQAVSLLEKVEGKKS